MTTNTRRQLIRSALRLPVAKFAENLAGNIMVCQTGKDQEQFEGPLIIKCDARYFVIQGRDGFVFPVSISLLPEGTLAQSARPIFPLTIPWRLDYNPGIKVG